MRRRIMVEPEQRYIQKSKTSPRKQVWEVESLSLDTARIEHGHLVNVRDRSDVKTLSCLALDGNHGFSLTST
jgi:hypothetical protein